MNRNGKTLWLAASVAMMALPGIASAQAQPMGQQPGMAQPQPGMQMQQPPGAGGVTGRAIPINGHFAFPLASGCNYQADVSGSARAMGGNTASADAQFMPSVTIDASVTCPNAARIHVTEQLSSVQPMTLAKLEQAIELRASLVSDLSGVHCAYVPDFRLTQQQLQGVGAALLCPLPARPNARGGGMQDDQNQIQQPAPVQPAPALPAPAQPAPVQPMPDQPAP